MNAKQKNNPEAKTEQLAATKTDVNPLSLDLGAAAEVLKNENESLRQRLDALDAKMDRLLAPLPIQECVALEGQGNDIEIVARALRKLAVQCGHAPDPELGEILGK